MPFFLLGIILSYNPRLFQTKGSHKPALFTWLFMLYFRSGKFVAFAWIYNPLPLPRKKTLSMSGWAKNRNSLHQSISIFQVHLLYSSEMFIFFPWIELISDIMFIIYKFLGHSPFEQTQILTVDTDIILLSSFKELFFSFSHNNSLIYYQK